MDDRRNMYRPEDAPGVSQIPGPRVFISHRSSDKAVAKAVASVLSALGVHYWLDEEDQDLQRAAALGMLGDQGLVHAIERGVRHSTTLIGLVSTRTVGSWWVPYEIGISRASDKTASFLYIDTGGDMIPLPEYVKIAPVFWSADELLRWSCTLGGNDLHTDLTHVHGDRLDNIAHYVRLDPPVPKLAALCEKSLDTISLLSHEEIHSVLALKSDTFDWLPSQGGAIREVAYDLFAPLAYYQLGLHAEPAGRELLEAAYLAPTRHYELAQQEPSISYQPETPEWRTARYRTQRSTWLQGLRHNQLRKRIERFLMTRDRNNRLRLATREEFKAEFDRVLDSGDTRSRRALGVLVNPLFGFTPELRPVYWRVLALQHHLYSAILGRRPGVAPFDEDTLRVVRRFLA